MTHQDKSLKEQKMLYRPRVNSLIHEGLKQPLLVMLAGPGYGKTEAMVSYISKCDADVLWLRLGTLDNLSSHFWDHLLQGLKNEYPAIASRLQEFEFPNTIISFDAFVNLLKNEIYKHKSVIWVFDDYGEIDNQEIKEFVRMLVEANLENFRLVLISNALKSTESIAFLTSKRRLLLADDLRFTKDEIGQLYNLYDIELENEELDAVEQYTQGWPLPLYLLVLEHDHLPDLIHENKKLSHRAIAHLFEEHFFSAYSLSRQKLFVKLSMLTSFTKEFAISLYEGNAIELQTVENHAFFIGEPASDRFFLHYLYRLFLQEKIYLLTQDEQRQLWQKAAWYYMSKEEHVEAVVCYRKCENYIGMIEAIASYINIQNEMTATTAIYFLEQIGTLTSKQIQTYPRAELLRAYLYMMLIRLEESEALLLDLIERLSSDEVLSHHDLLCDGYATLGLVHMMQNKESFCEDFKNAAKSFDFISPEEQIKKSGKMRMQNGHAFSMADKLPGAKERMERTVHDAVPWMTKIWSGDISGIEHVFSAEASYLSLELDTARQHAYRGVYEAVAYKQHDLVCNAYLLLARIGFMQGDFNEMSKQIQNLTEYAANNDIAVVRKIRDTALGWYYVKLHEYLKIPKSILEFSKTEPHNLGYGRPQLVYSHYLIGMGEYARLIGMLEYPLGLYLVRGIWPDRASRDIMLAIGYHCIGNDTSAMDTLWSAYDMCYHNGLIALFVEAGDHMRELIKIAREQEKYKFSPEWLDLIDLEAKKFTNRAEAVRRAYRKKNPVKMAPNNPLSKREQEVLQAISRGLTREEIAIEQYISVNTVKSTIKNIYNKLNANNKGDAVSIAIANGYIEGHR